MKTNRTVTILFLVAMLSIVAIPIAEYIGGRLCFFPIALPFPIPAQTAAYGIWLCAMGILLGSIIRSVKNRHKIYVPYGAFTIALVSACVFVVNYEPMSGFLVGLQSRFVHKVGYATMRQFAEEVSQKPEGIVLDNRKANPQNHLDESRRKELASRYPFLNWLSGHAKVYFSDDVVEVTWGAGIAGSWGFQVATQGMVENIEGARTLRPTEAIQFIYYE